MNYWIFESEIPSTIYHGVWSINRHHFIQSQRPHWWKKRICILVVNGLFKTGKKKIVVINTRVGTTVMWKWFLSWYQHEIESKRCDNHSFDIKKEEFPDFIKSDWARNASNEWMNELTKNKMCKWIYVSSSDSKFTWIIWSMRCTCYGTLSTIEWRKLWILLVNNGWVDDKNAKTFSFYPQFIYEMKKNHSCWCWAIQLRIEWGKTSWIDAIQNKQTSSAAMKMNAHIMRLWECNNFRSNKNVWIPARMSEFFNPKQTKGESSFSSDSSQLFITLII